MLLEPLLGLGYEVSIVLAFYPCPTVEDVYAEDNNNWADQLESWYSKTSKPVDVNRILVDPKGSDQWKTVQLALERVAKSDISYDFVTVTRFDCVFTLPVHLTARLGMELEPTKKLMWSNVDWVSGIQVNKAN
jgi:hypothetical protein